MASEQQILVEHLLQGPPAGFNVIIVQCDVWVIEINPERHALSHLSPSLFIGPNTVATFFVKFGHTEGFNRFVAHQIKTFLDLNFHW